MTWGRSEVLGLASASCVFCHGYGLRPIRSLGETVCGCVFREIFRACLHRVRECQVRSRDLRGVAWERVGGVRGFRCYSRPREEYLADCCLVARRNLAAEDWRIFEMHHLGKLDYRDCCVRLRTDRGTFFHRVYAIEERLGRVFSELRPYSLYPVADYFSRVASADVAAGRPCLGARELRCRAA